MLGAYVLVSLMVRIVFVQQHVILLHSQMQEGFRDDLLKSLTVSGAQTLKSCLAVKNEERRLHEVCRRLSYHWAGEPLSYYMTGEPLSYHSTG